MSDVEKLARAYARDQMQRICFGGLTVTERNANETALALAYICGFQEAIHTAIEIERARMRAAP